MSAIRAMSVFTTQGDRPVQEDYVLANREKGIFVVADGFGGTPSGPAAARAACESVRNFLEKEAGDLEATLPFVLRTYFSLAGNVLFNALIHANRKVAALNRNRNVNEKGGASVLAGFLDEDLLALANVGACDAWLFRGGEAASLVVPRTFARLCDPFTREPPSHRHVPLIALGMAEDLEPEIFEYRVRPGDWLLLHTDGITAGARDQLLECQRKQLKPSEAAQGAIELLKESRFSDNAAITLVIF
jgi:protein phosphatase